MPLITISDFLQMIQLRFYTIDANGAYINVVADVSKVK